MLHPEICFRLTFHKTLRGQCWKANTPQQTTQHTPCESKIIKWFPKLPVFVCIMHISTVFSSVFFGFLAFFWLDLSQDWGAAICSPWRLAWLGNSQISPGRVMWHVNNTNLQLSWKCWTTLYIDDSTCSQEEDMYFTNFMQRFGMSQPFLDKTSVGWLADATCKR